MELEQKLVLGLVVGGDGLREMIPLGFELRSEGLDVGRE